MCVFFLQEALEKKLQEQVPGILANLQKMLGKDQFFGGSKVRLAFVYYVRKLVFKGGSSHIALSLWVGPIECYH